MNLPKKGPELKLSELKVPDFVYDLYYDLKERHLLPLVAVLAIAVVVVPIALSSSTGDSGEDTPVATPSVAGSEASTLTVAESAPGLREYSRRLKDARALDPFRASSEAAAASEAAPVAETPTAVSETPTAPEVTESPSYTPVETPIESMPPVTYPTGPEGSGTTVTETETKYASLTVDLRIVTVPHGDKARASAKPSTEIRRELPELTMLPSREAPAAVFMGTSSDGKKALLLVSSDVQSIFGDGQCIVGSETCQLLALEAGVPETFVYGKQAKTYRIEILKISKNLSSKPRKAPLGKPKKKGAATEAPEEAGKEAPAAAAGRVSSAQPR